MVLLGQPNYAAVADLITRLPQTVATTRSLRGVSPATAAKQMGIARSTLSQFESGSNAPNQYTILAALRWLAQS